MPMRSRFLAAALLLTATVAAPRWAGAVDPDTARTTAPATTRPAVASSNRDDPASVGAATASVGAGLDLTIASLQARQKKLESAQTTPDDATVEALRDYAAAVDQLVLASEWKQRAEALSRLQREGPRILESTRREVESWPRQAPAPLGSVATRADVEPLLAETEARLSVVRRGLLDVDAESAQLAERRLSLPAELAAAGAAREGVLGELDLPPLPTGSVESSLARRALALAEQKATGEQVGALELELASYELRRELVIARRELLKRKSEALATRVSELQGTLTERRLREAETTAAEARADQASLARVHPILGSLAEENARLTAERTGSDGLSARIDATARRLSSVGEELQRLGERSKGVRQKVAAAGLTDSIGLLLRKERGELADADRTRADIRSRREEIAAVQLESLNLEDLQKALPGVESEVEKILSAQAATLAPAERARIEASARNVLKTRRSYLDTLIRDYNTYFASLVDLDAKEIELVKLLDDYSAFLDQHVLWIPNASLPDLRAVGDWRDAALWLVDPRNHAALGQRLIDAARSAPIGASSGLLLLLAGIVYRRRLKRLHARLCDTTGEPATALLPAPAAVLLVGALLALPGPFAAWFLAWMLRTAPTPPDDFSHAAAGMLAGLSFPLFVAEFLRRAVSNDGPAAAFLRWPRAALAPYRTQIVFAETVVLPTYALAMLFDGQPQQDWNETLGRAAFCVGIGAAGLGLHRLLSPNATLVPAVLRRPDLEWMRPVLARVSVVSTLIAVLVIALATLGYYYTALVLTERLWLSALALLVYVVANASALRWLEAKEAVPAEEPGEDDIATEAAADPRDTQSISQVSAQTRSLLRIVFGVALVAAFFSVWVDVFPALRFFEKIELWQVSAVVERTVGAGDAARVESVPMQVPVTVANLLFALLGTALAVVGARNLPGLLELAILSRLQLDRGLRYAISTVTGYAFFLVGSIVALQNLGVEWSNVQWLVAAVSVGLGFGLQEIFGNFVSGLILLFERPVRVGDTVTIDGITGVVSRIEMRATTVVDGDRKELIVPNKELITGKLVNWSLRDSTVRLVVPIGVAYGSDTTAVVRILLEVSKQCATVLETPPPMIAFTRFGDSSLDFELRVFVVHPDLIGPTRHELLMAVERRFRKASIEIPFPQRDVHLRSVATEVGATLATPSPAAPAASGQSRTPSTSEEPGTPPSASGERNPS